MGIPGITEGPIGPAPVPRSGLSGPPPPRETPPIRPDGPSRFLVVTTPTCGWCHRTLSFLEALQASRRDFEVEVLDANAEPERFAAIHARTRSLTVPQVFLDGAYVGGWRELADAARSGRLDAYLDGADWRSGGSSRGP